MRCLLSVRVSAKSKNAENVTFSVAIVVIWQVMTSSGDASMRTMIDFVDLGSSGEEIEFADYYRGKSSND